MISTRIFISYSRHDADYACALEAQLQTHGFNVWLDTDRLRMGEFWREEIVQAIENCDYFLLLLSVHSTVSVNVVRELSLAESSAKRILPMMLHQVEIPDTMKYQLAGLQIVFVDAARQEQVIENLLKFLPISTDQETVCQVRSAPKVLPYEGDGSWDGSQLLTHLTLAIGPMATFLLASMPDRLLASDVQELRAMVQRHGIDAALLDEALNMSRVPSGEDAAASTTAGLPNEEALADWFRLRVGPIAEVIWDEQLRKALGQAPQEARARLEGLGVDPNVIDELLLRAAGNSGPDLGQNKYPTPQAHG